MFEWMKYEIIGQLIHVILPSALLLFSNVNCHPTSSAGNFISAGKLPFKLLLFSDSGSTDVAVADRLLIRGLYPSKQEVNY